MAKGDRLTPTEGRLGPRVLLRRQGGLAKVINHDVKHSEEGVGIVRIPRQSCHSFHTKAATDSMTRLPPIPRQSCHRFQEKAATPAVRTASMRRWGNPIGILHFSHIVREEQMPAQR